jgi:hypothetical protein
MGLLSLATTFLAFGSAASAASLAKRNSNSQKLTPGLCQASTRATCVNKVYSCAEPVRLLYAGIGFPI